MIENKEKSKELMVPLSKAFENYGKIINFSKKRAIPLSTIEHVPPCVIKNYDLSKIVNYSPDFNRKILLQDGKIHDASKPHKNYAFKKSCRKCAYFRGCAGFDPEYANFFGTGEFKPVISRQPVRKILFYG